MLCPSQTLRINSLQQLPRRRRKRPKSLRRLHRLLRRRQARRHRHLHRLPHRKQAEVDRNYLKLTYARPEDLRHVLSRGVVPRQRQ
jgi:hypothetical protein